MKSVNLLLAGFLRENLHPRYLWTLIYGDYRQTRCLLL